MIDEFSELEEFPGNWMLREIVRCLENSKTSNTQTVEKRTHRLALNRVEQSIQQTGHQTGHQTAPTQNGTLHGPQRETPAGNPVPTEPVGGSGDFNIEASGSSYDSRDLLNSNSSASWCREALPWSGQQKPSCPAGVID